MIIALTGYAQSGKDTVGRMLVEHHGYTRKAFADKLKQLAKELNPLLDDDGYMLQWYLNGGHFTGNQSDWEYAKSFPEVREFLQKLGVACRNVLGPNVWVDAVMREMRTQPANYVVTDVRFLNEASVLRGNFKDVRIVRIVRPGYGPLNDHVSETELDSIRVDHTLVNDGDLYDLERKVRSLVIDDTVLV